MKCERLVKVLSDLLRNVTFPRYDDQGLREAGASGPRHPAREAPAALAAARALTRVLRAENQRSPRAPASGVCSPQPPTVCTVAGHKGQRDIQLTGGDTWHFVLSAKAGHVGWGRVIFSSFCFKIIDSQEITNTLQRSYVPQRRQLRQRHRIQRWAWPLPKASRRSPGLWLALPSRVLLSLPFHSEPAHTTDPCPVLAFANHCPGPCPRTRSCKWSISEWPRARAQPPCGISGRLCTADGGRWGFSGEHWRLVTHVPGSAASGLHTAPSSQAAWPQVTTPGLLSLQGPAPEASRMSCREVTLWDSGGQTRKVRILGV